MYKLDPEDFQDETGIQRLITFLENSPMNKQPIPDAGAKLSAYYRKLNRRTNETIPQFLVREEYSYDMMWRSLQRFLREKQVDFSKYEVTEKELRVFCGMKPNESFFYDEEEEEAFAPPQTPDDDEEEPASTETRNPFASPPLSRANSQKSSSAAAPVQKRKRDLIEMLMRKGLIPLAALDIIRGWMILEATASTDYDKSLIKASTQNKLGYQEVRSALLSMHEDRGREPLLTSRHGRPSRSFAAHWIGDENLQGEEHDNDEYQEQYQAWSDQPWPEQGWEENMFGDQSEQWQAEDTVDAEAGETEDPEHSALMSQLQEEERGLQAMLADTQRSLVQARKAVSEARRDRGWQGHPGGKPKPTSTFVSKGKGGSKSKGNFQGPGFYNSPQSSQMMWNSPGFPKGGNKGFQFSKGKGKGKPNKAWFHEMQYESGMLALESEMEDMFTVSPKSHPSGASPPATRITEPGGTKGVIDTGATVSAGGKRAVQELVTELAKTRPDLKVTIAEDRPWFRYGSGKWGQALFKVKLTTGGISFELYSLPSENVPVLVGMRELDQMNVILNCKTRNAIISGKPCVLQATSKGHAVLDFAVDVPFSHDASTDDQFVCESPECHVATCCPNESEFFEDVQSFNFESFTVEHHHQSQPEQFSLQHLGVTQSEWSFLTQSGFQSDFEIPAAPLVSPQAKSEHGDRPKSRIEEDDEGSARRGSQRALGSRGQRGERPDIATLQASRKVCFEDESQKEDDRVRRIPQDRESMDSRPSKQGKPVAMYGSAYCGNLQQQVGQVAGVSEVRTPHLLHTSRRSSIDSMPATSPSKCQPGFGTPSTDEVESRNFGQSYRQEHDQNGGSRVRGEQGQERQLYQEPQGCEEQGHDPRTAGDRVRWFVRGTREQEDGRMTEMSFRDMERSQKIMLGESVRKNWATFDSAQALRDLRGCESEHLWEICCSPHSALSNEMRRQKFQATRLNYENGFDLGSKQKVAEAIARIPVEKPTRVWASPRCTAVSSIQNINQRTDLQRRELYQKRLRTIREIRNLIDIFKAAYARRPGSTHIYMEWPKSAYFGWRLKEWETLREWLESNFSQKLFWAEVHGCMYGHKHGDEFLNKPWLILTTDFDFFCSVSLKCDGSHQHKPIMGIGSEAVHSTAFYPVAMVRRIVQTWKKQWFNVTHADVTKSLYNAKVSDAELLNLLQEADKLCSADLFPFSYGGSSSSTFRRTDGPKQNESGKESEIVAEQPTSEERERVLSMLHRLHRAAGHPTNASLAKLCLARKMSPWIVEEARKLECQACRDTQRGAQKILPVSISEKPKPWEVVAMDAFELTFPQQQQKARYVIMMCTAMHFMAIACTWIGSMSTTGTDSGPKVIETFCDTWLLHRPRWVMMDSQTSFAQGVFPQFLQSAGIGAVVIAPEAHWQNGVAESLIGASKRTMRRLRNEDPDLSPQAVGALAAFAHNHMDRQKGFSPVQWAYGVDPDAWENPSDPLFVNKDKQFGSHTFVQLQAKRDLAQRLSEEEQARSMTTRLLNAASRESLKFSIGDHVCVWRCATLKARKRDENYSPEPRFIGPGRVILIEPPIQSDRRPGVIWVLMGSTVYRCAPEQIRFATQTEILVDLMKQGRSSSLPKEDLMKKLQSYVDITNEASNVPSPQGTVHQEEAVQDMDAGDEWEENLRQGFKRERADDPQPLEQRRRTTVEEMKRKWNQLISVNENRRREGLPPIMRLPNEELPDPLHGQIPHGPVALPMQETADTVFSKSLGVEQAEVFAAAFKEMDAEVKQEILNHIEKLENATQNEEDLLDQIRQEEIQEKQILFHLREETKRGTDASKAWFIEFEISDNDAFVANNLWYVKKVLEAANHNEVRYEQLSEEHKPLFDEAQAREVSEVIQSMALRRIESEEEYKDAMSHPERHIPMRWVLTWKTQIPPEKPVGPGPHVATQSGEHKAKARVVLIGFRHPDLVARNHMTGRPVLKTSSPTISRLGKHLLLQAIAFDEHELESADAKSAFLQAENQEESRRLWTKAVPEIAVAMGVKPGGLMRILGAIYGLTNAPRIFWRDVSLKLKSLGAIQNPIDRCLWIVPNESGEICGRIGSQVDDFVFGGNMADPVWQKFREDLKKAYKWSPWQKGEFQFSGCKLSQSLTYSITLSQEEFCNSLFPVAISNEKSRSGADALSPTEISQTRALLMKAQWRALQSAPQFCARINLASSEITRPTLKLLQEANHIVKDMKKTAKDDLTFHAFNFGRKMKDRLTFRDLVFLQWGDASHKNRTNNYSTGGLVVGISTPEIHKGIESPVSVVDWRSWKLKRVVAGSNSSESQAIFEAEDKGFRARLIFALLYGLKLRRNNSESLAATFLSFLIMDSRGCYDALTNTETPGLSMENARSSVDILGISQGLEEDTNQHPAWVPGDMNLADSLTKNSVEAWKTFMLYLQRKSWVLKFNDSFISARKQQKLRRQKRQQEIGADIPEEWLEDPLNRTFGDDVER